MPGNRGAADQKGNKAEKYFAALTEEIRTSQLAKGQARQKARGTVCYWWETGGYYTERTATKVAVCRHASNFSSAASLPSFPSSSTNKIQTFPLRNPLLSFLPSLTHHTRFPGYARVFPYTMTKFVSPRVSYAHRMGNSGWRDLSSSIKRCLCE